MAAVTIVGILEPQKGLSSQSCGFSSSLWMWELDYKESWAPKNWCFWTVILEKTLESSLDCKDTQPVHPKGDQSCSLEGLMLELKLQYFGHLMWKANSLEKIPILGKIEGRRRRGATEDEMIGWHHQLHGYEFEQTLGDSEGQGDLVCWSPWGHRVGHDLATEQNWINLLVSKVF